MRFAQAKKYVT